MRHCGHEDAHAGALTLLTPSSAGPFKEHEKARSKFQTQSNSNTPVKKVYVRHSVSSSRDCRSKYGTIFFKMQTLTKNSLYQYVADILNREARRIRSFIMRARQLVGSVAAPDPCRY